MSDVVNETIAARLGELNDIVVDHADHLADIEARLERLEKSLVGQVQAAVTARTTPANADASARGLVIDEQQAMIDARASQRRHTPVQPVGVPGYGRRP
jgi:hypothetical protein